MKVNDSIKNKVDLGLDKVLTEKNTKAKEPEVKSTSDQTSQSDSVTLSSVSVQLQAIQSDISTSEVFDAKKVDAIKSAISNGEFKVDSEKVADGLINTVKDLFKNH